MDCSNKNRNLDRCNCTYPGCPRKGICCECLRYHLDAGEVPACFFDAQAEKTYNRSIAYFIQEYRRS